MTLVSNNISSKNVNVFLLFNIIQPIGIAQFYLGSYKKAIFRLFCFGYSIFGILGYIYISPLTLSLIPVTTSIAIFLYVKDFYQMLRGTIKDSDGKRLLSPWEASKKEKMKLKEKWIAGKNQYKEDLVNLKQESSEFKKIMIDSKEELKDLKAELKDNYGEFKADVKVMLKEDMANAENTKKDNKADLPHITTQEEFDQLKSGDQYINSDGDHMEKP
jgi:hypothetical protein